jgi:hypothetical protein
LLLLVTYAGLAFSILKIRFSISYIRENRRKFLIITPVMRPSPVLLTRACYKAARLYLFGRAAPVDAFRWPGSDRLATMNQKEPWRLVLKLQLALVVSPMDASAGAYPKKKKEYGAILKMRILQGNIWKRGLPTYANNLSIGIRPEVSLAIMLSKSDPPGT